MKELKGNERLEKNIEAAIEVVFRVVSIAGGEEVGSGISSTRG